MTTNAQIASPRFIVQTASAKMPAKCWGRYGRVAVIEVTPGVSRVAMISERARGVVEIVKTWEKLNVGNGSGRCAYSKAKAEAQAMADRLNGLASFDPSI